MANTNRIHLRNVRNVVELGHGYEGNPRREATASIYVHDDVYLCHFAMREVSGTTVNYIELFLRVRIDVKLNTDKAFDGCSARIKHYTASASAESLMTLKYSLYSLTISHRVL